MKPKKNTGNKAKKKKVSKKKDTKKLHMFTIVLVEPKIPPNTGTIARLCAATNIKLDLVGDLGFSLDDKSLKRAGLDYWHLMDIEHHPST